MADDYDYVRVVDAITSTVLGEYYKGDNPTTISAATTKMQIVFQTNTSQVAGGFEIYYTTTTDIEEQPEGYSMLVYPNPASDMLNIIPGNNAAGATIVIYDFSGRCIFSHITDGSQLLIPANNFASGLYSVGMLSEQGNVWQKIVVE